MMSMTFFWHDAVAKRIRSFLGAAIVSLSMVPVSPAMAQSPIQFLPTPPDQGAPDGRQRGGATRGDCLAYKELTALVPTVNGVVWSQTASATPQFFFKIPAALTDDIPLEFVIQDSEDNYVLYQALQMEAAAGLISVPTTTTDSGLIAGESYSWTFSIYCDAERPSASVSVKGTVQRVETTIVDPRNLDPVVELSAEEQLALMQQFAAEGIWHEAIEIAIALNHTEPNNVTYLAALESLFEQAGITE